MLTARLAELHQKQIGTKAESGAGKLQDSCTADVHAGALDE